jgi:hypothetical protein
LPGNIETDRINERIRYRLDRLRLPDIGPAPAKTRNGLKAVMDRGRDDCLSNGPFEKPHDPARPLVYFVATEARVDHRLTNSLKLERPEVFRL